MFNEQKLTVPEVSNQSLPFLTVNRLAELLHLEPRTLKSHLFDQDVRCPSAALGAQDYVVLEDVTQWLRSRYPRTSGE